MAVNICVLFVLLTGVKPHLATRCRHYSRVSSNSIFMVFKLYTVLKAKLFIRQLLEIKSSQLDFFKKSIHYSKMKRHNSDFFIYII